MSCWHRDPFCAGVWSYAISILSYAMSYKHMKESTEKTRNSRSLTKMTGMQQLCASTFTKKRKFDFYCLMYVGKWVNILSWTWRTYWNEFLIENWRCTIALLKMYLAYMSLFIVMIMSATTTTNRWWFDNRDHVIFPSFDIVY